MTTKKKASVDTSPELFNWFDTAEMKKIAKKQDPYPYDNTKILINSRILCVGGTSSGKSQALLHYIRLSPDTFSKIIVYTKESEDLYELLKQKLQSKIEVNYGQTIKIPTLAKLREDYAPNERILVVFDDHMDNLGNPAKNCPNVIDYLTYGRKKNITLFMLTQDFYSIKKALRNQMSYILVFKLTQLNDINAVLRQYDTKQKILKDIYEDSTEEPLSFLKINTMVCPMNEKFSKGFVNFYEIE